MMENLRNIPTEVAGRAIRLHGGGSAVSTQRDSKSFLSSLVVFSFSWCWSQQVKNKDERWESSRTAGASLGYSGIDSASSARLLPSFQTCFSTFRFLEINNWPTLIFIFVLLLCMYENRYARLLYRVHTCTHCQRALYPPCLFPSQILVHTHLLYTLSCSSSCLSSVSLSPFTIGRRYPLGGSSSKTSAVHFHLEPHLYKRTHFNSKQA